MLFLSEMQLKLKKFQMSYIPDDAVVVFIGKRRTGKSLLLKDLLYYHQDIPVGTVISPTEACNRFYSDIIPPLFIHDEFQSSIVQNVLKRQTKIINKIEKKAEPEYINADPRSFLVFDDCLYDNTWAKDKWVRYVFMNGRHLKILFLVTMQYAMGIPPNLRTNIDYTFICRENNLANRKRLFEQYAGVFHTFEMFCQVMDQCTENYECLVFNNISKSNKLEDQVFWYKAEVHENQPFRIGSDLFWKHHHENYKGGEDVDNEAQDWRALTGKKNRISIMVEKEVLQQQQQQQQQQKKRGVKNILPPPVEMLYDGDVSADNVNDDDYE